MRYASRLVREFALDRQLSHRQLASPRVQVRLGISGSGYSLRVPLSLCGQQRRQVVISDGMGDALIKRGECRLACRHGSRDLTPAAPQQTHPGILTHAPRDTTEPGMSARSFGACLARLDPGGLPLTLVKLGYLLADPGQVGTHRDQGLRGHVPARVDEAEQKVFGTNVVVAQQA